MTITTDTTEITEPDSGDATDAAETYTAAADPVTEQDYPVVEARYMRLDELIIDDNVRKNFDISQCTDMADSIRHHGIGAPIKAYRFPDNTIHAFDGQLRILIALEVGRTHGPVWIEPAPDLTAKERIVARVFEQITLNDHRVALTDGDRAGGIAEVLDLGVSVTRVSKGIAERDLDKIRQAGRVGRSATARALLDDSQLNLDQAAILADFDAVGDQAAVERLQQAAPSMFLFEAHRITQERDEDRDRLSASLPYAVAGFAVAIIEPDILGEAAPYLPASELTTGDGQPVTPDVLHASPDGWVVYLVTSPEQVLVDPNTGAIVDPDTIDPNTRSNPEAVPAQGLRHANSVESRPVWVPRYYLPTPLLDTSGYQLAAPEEPEAVEATATDSDTADQPAPTVPADRTAARSAPISVARETVDQVSAADREAEQAAQRARTEQARAEREAAARENKRLQARHDKLTKDFTAATSARIDFVRKFLERTTAPASAQRFLLETSGVHSLELDEYIHLQTALHWLGITGSRAGLAEAADKARPGRCTVMALALAFTNYEAHIARDAWAHKDPRTSYYLHYLADLGHRLTPVEQAAAGDVDPASLDPGA